MASKALALIHYASENYDPVKAHEYYLKNRELQKQSAGPELSAESRQRQSEARSYATNQIQTKRKADLDKLQTDRDAAQTSNQARLEKLTKTAEEASARIQKKLTDRLAAIQTELNIPSNASPKLRAFLLRQRSKQAQSAKQAGQQELAALQQNLQKAVSQARTEYAAARAKFATDRTATVDKYKTMQETEDKNITEQVR